MAKTFPTLRMKATTPFQPAASWLRITYPKGSSTTFPKGAPLKNASGLLDEFVNPTDGDIVAFAMVAGTSGETEVECLPATHDVVLEGNFLGSSAADNTLAEADLWKSVDLASNANLHGTGDAGWYIQDTTSDPAVTIVEFESQYVFPTQNDYKAATGDTNARVRAHVNPGVSAWY